mgnify:CR=1 FL=1
MKHSMCRNDTISWTVPGYCIKFNQKDGDVIIGVARSFNQQQEKSFPSIADQGTIDPEMVSQLFSFCFAEEQKDEAKALTQDAIKFMSENWIH